jgi:hypothetical protein
MMASCRDLDPKDDTHDHVKSEMFGEMRDSDHPRFCAAEPEAKNRINVKRHSRS